MQNLAPDVQDELIGERDPEGRTLRWCSIRTDVDDQKRFEEALRSSELNFRLIVDSIPGLVCTMSAAGEVELLNRQVLEYFGKTAEEMKGWATSDAAVHPDDLPRVLAAFTTSIETGHPYHIEHRCRRADGVYRWFQVRALPVRDTEDRILSWYILLTDIDKRKQAEDRLQLLLDVTNQVVSNLQLRDLLRAIWGNIRRVMQCDFASLALPHAENKQLQLYVLDFSEGKGFLHEEGRYSIEGSPYGTAFRTMKPVALDSPFTAWPDNPVVQSRICGGFKSLCFLPLIRRNRAIGTLNLGRLRDDAFTEEDLYFLSQVANQIAIAVENALAYRAMATLEEQRASERVYLEEEILSGAMFEEIVGSSKALVRTLGYVARVAPTDSTVLITGESGTGKELVARALHKRSRRASRPFVRVNCAALPPSLIASELFGHEKGAFTGATERRLGRFELANGGTIFLDEIGDVPADTQIALLRVLQERELDRVGGSHPVSVDVRVVAATNRDLKAAVDAGTFRLDLFYRLNVFPVRVPSLRERADDIPLLAKYFIERYATTAGKRIRNIDKKTLELFQAYHWPGNIREMQNVIERAVILCDRETFSVDESWMQREAPPSVCETPVALTEALVSREKQMIQAALEESRGRIFGPSGAAVKLGIPRSTLESRIRTLRIDKYRFKAEEPTSTTSILANSRQLAKSHHG